MAGKIPIKDAENISDKRKCPVVIIFGLEETGNRFTVTTYGKTKKLCRYAGDLGKKIADKILNGEINPSQIEPIDLPDKPAEWIGKMLRQTDI